MSNQPSPAVINLVIDGVGIKTLEYLLDNSDAEVRFPNLVEMGLGNLLDKRFCDRVVPNNLADFANSVVQASESADSVVGHREMVGVIDDNRHELFFKGFPATFIQELENRIGRKTIFNQMADGTEVIKPNHVEHSSTGSPIVYASMCDPIIQFSMNEAVIPVPEQRRIVDVAFDLAREREIGITRAIARPYVDTEDGFVRTANRYDRALDLKEECLIDVLRESGVYNVSIGKPAELISTRSWNLKMKPEDVHTLDEGGSSGGAGSNAFIIQGVLNILRGPRDFPYFIFANCVDTDSLYGHSQNVEGSLAAIQEVDKGIGRIYREMGRGDVLIVSADHGMEHRGNYGYHIKEELPVLARRKGRGIGIDLGSNETLASVGYLVAECFGVEKEYVRRCKLERFFEG